MKKLFLLPVIALIALICLNLAAASKFCCPEPTMGTCGDGAYVSTNPCPNNLGCPDENCGIINGPWCCDGYCLEYQQCENCHCIPEFTTIGMGIAIAGAGIGWALIRKKRK